jgi:hypothetical protein
MASAEVESPPKKEPLFWAHLLGWFRSIPRTALLSMVGPSLLLLFGYFGWRYYGARHYENTFYGISKPNVIVSQPEWIKTSVVDEVFEKTGLENVSLFDSQAALVIARAFDAHPTVRKTHRVHLVSGGQVFVNAEFREPVAMVHCDSDDGRSSFLPIDREGVLLPRDHFQQKDVPNYIWIYAKGIRDSEDRLEGRRFGDVRIEQAAALSAYLAPYRERAMISRINVYTTGQGKSAWKFELVTAGGPNKPGPRILWGCPLGQEGLAEPAAQAKLTRLLDAASDRNAWSQEVIDLSKPATRE